MGSSADSRGGKLYRGAETQHSQRGGSASGAGPFREGTGGKPGDGHMEPTALLLHPQAAVSQEGGCGPVL